MALNCIQLEPRPNIQGYYDCAVWQEIEPITNSNDTSNSYVSFEYAGILITYSIIMFIFASFVRITSRDIFD